MVLVFALCLLQDPAETLRDPLKRAKEADRKAAIEAFKAREFDGPFFWAAVRFLEKGDAGWKLRADGAVDPAASGLDIYLVRYGRPDLSEDDHRAALDTLVAIVEKTKTTSQAHDALRVFAVVHLSALGDQANAAHAGRLGFTRVEGRWGTADQHTHAAVAHGFEHPEKLDASVEATARGSASFGARYAALLAKLQRTLAQRQNHEAMFQELAGAGAGGGPRGAVEHLKALAMSFKAAVYCKECKSGKLVCPQCKGKKRVDAKCPDCGGEGRLKSTGDVGAGATQRCNLCNASGLIKDSACPTCSKSGAVDCGKCAGSPWFDRACSGAGCRGGKRPCSACKGKTRIDVTCKECGGGGRIKAPGDAGAGATHKCRGCEGRGTLKEALPCEACSKSSLGKGLEQCDTCGGSGKERRGAIGAGDVFSTDKCASCRGDGFPLPNMAVACPKCAGLGAIVKPVADPSKVLGD
jgi:hypothetical protein